MDMAKLPNTECLNHLMAHCRIDAKIASDLDVDISRSLSLDIIFNARGNFFEIHFLNHEKVRNRDLVILVIILQVLFERKKERKDL